ncbi:hypothetical protein VC562_27955, partial [Citrobacter freundii]|nr:hypothetical protein [Citrobacter freundii]MEB0410133.1 hypothetical protein [Citrobacter freundii]
DGDGSHGSTSKTPSYTKSVSWHHYPQWDTPFGRYVYGRISENYRRIFEQENDLPAHYKEAQLLADAISGMTDSYLIALHDELATLYQYECRQR